MKRCLFAVLVALVATATVADEVDIPAVDALEPVTVEPVESVTYDKVYPVLLVYRYLKQGDEYRPIMQRLTLAPARRTADGSIDVLLDADTFSQFDGVDMRTERGRSPVFRAMMDEFVEVMGLMAKERAVREQIEAAKAEEPEADTAALEATLANLHTALEISQ